MQQIKDHTKKIALGLRTVGLINIQFAIKDDIVYIIEANPRASVQFRLLQKHTENRM
jgi:carbamoyl-phosphate synthase large subunit